MMKTCVVLLILEIVQRSCAVIYRLNDEEHNRMPPTFNLDPYGRCLRRPGGRYCTAYVTYVADGASPLLTLMKEYSDHASSHFNHTRAIIGTCLTEKCKDIEGNTSDPRSYLETCLNRTVWDEYKLKVKVDDEVYCHEHGEKKPEVGPLDIAVAAGLMILVLCNIVGSLCDIFCLKQDGTVCRFLLCFSIPGNWKILTSPAGASDPRLERLKGLYGIRAISMTAVIAVHGLLPATIVTDNNKFIEDLYDTTHYHMLINGTLIIQTFLFLSSFLLSYTWQLHAETHQVTWKTVPKGILSRWVRLTAPYVVMLALTATWLPRLNTGPIWDHIVVSSSEACRRDWWQHVLYVNTYYLSLCMPHTWYLATDIQLYFFGLVVFVGCQSPRARRLVLPALFLASLLVPALHTYYQDLDGPLVVSPAAGLNAFTTDRTFNTVYKRAHTNVTNYVLGLAAGYLVYSLQRNNFDAAKYKAWRYLYWLLFPLALAIFAACKVFYAIPRVGLGYRVAAAALLKPVFGLIVALIIVGMIFKMDNLYRGVLEWRGWVPLSRVSYSAYLLHVAHVYASSGALQQPLQASYLRMGEMVLCTVTMVYLSAYLFWLTVEAPLTQIVKNSQLGLAGKKNTIAEEKLNNHEQNMKKSE